jgi:hypothetical protein
VFASDHSTYDLVPKKSRNFFRKDDLMRLLK